MHKMLIVSLSALALMGGAATAQTVAQTGMPTSDAASPDRTGAHGASRAPGMAAPSVDSLMNRPVIGSDGERIGKVTDVILGPDGQAQLIVIRSGGFLGIGGKDIAADLKLAEFEPGANAIRLREVTTASVRDMPEFRYDDSMTSLNRSPQGGR
ncbi:PRC-barrel domain-containing protein [Azospirillum agricola]|uniref:PRC-barrel domain-containing protein n=1 Tax=Azospirillum agricola TaxID=1720247 RepID=UPI000A0F135A|nr:PRC-barrel domain-containing protein [Azospirillum agricola]SMH54186.1 PRC-barrel domain-containing protein [Azospirillum lipoferum]